MRRSLRRSCNQSFDLWAGSEKCEWGPFRYMTASTRHLESRGVAKYAARFAARRCAASSFSASIISSTGSQAAVTYVVQAFSHASHEHEDE